MSVFGFIRSWFDQARRIASLQDERDRERVAGRFWLDRWRERSRWAESDRLPDGIRGCIYRGMCCVDSPEKAAKEPCACAAGSIIDQIEEWHMLNKTREVHS